MSVRPAEFVQWATDGGAAITEPPLARKEEGWVPAFPPSAAYQNWWMNRVGKWVEYFDTNNVTDAKGWTTVPVETISGGGSTIAFGVGEVLTGGKHYAVPASASFSGLAASTDYYWSFVVLSGTIEQFTSWDTANAGTNVPLFWAKTTAGSLITTSASSGLAKRVLQIADTLTLTVSSDPVHRAHFTTLKQALAAAQAIQQGSTLAAPAIRIEIIGSLTEPAPIDEAELYGSTDITIAGRSAGSSLVQSARILFSSATKGLFYVPSGASIQRWTFEDLAFAYTGNASSAEVAVVSAQTGSSVSGLNFFRCSSTATTSLNKFPHFIYSEVAISSLVIHDCRISNSETMIHQTTGGIAGLDIRSVVFNRFAALTDIGTVFGFIVSKAGSSSRWRINGCTVGESTSIRGPAVEAFALDGAWITGNRFELSGDTSAILLGDMVAAAPAGVNRIWISDNYIERDFASISSASVVRIRTADDALGAAQIFIHSNAIMGDDAVAPTAKGIELDAGSGSLSQPIIHSNSISRVLEGVYLTAGITKGVVAANAMTVLNRGIYAFTTSSNMIAIGNSISNNATEAATIRAPNSIYTGNWTNGSATFNAANLLVSGNQFGAGATGGTSCSNFVFAANYSTSLTASGGNAVYTANQFDAVVSLGDNNTYTGNVIDSLDIDPSSGSDNLVLVGNLIADTGTVSVTCADSILAANRWAGNVSLTTAADRNVFASNYVVGTYDTEASETVTVGNRFSLAFSATGNADNVVVTGNLFAVATTIPIGTTEWCVDGNVFLGVFNFQLTIPVPDSSVNGLGFNRTPS